MEGDARQVLPCILCGGAGIALTVLANHRHRFLVAEQLEEIGAPAKTIVLEPSGRNTAPAACVAALIAAEKRQQHTHVYRPWGWYQGFDRGDRYHVKCIMVRGTVEVTKGDEVKRLGENESAYIPVGEKHRVANPGKVPAFLIEVQTGITLDEDDIVRYDDIYGRSPTKT